MGISPILTILKYELKKAKDRRKRTSNLKSKFQFINKKGECEMLTQSEFDYLIGVCKENRENSMALSQLPNQNWKESHELEVKAMNTLIEKLEKMKAKNRI